jgi:hypothetical protein
MPATIQRRSEPEIVEKYGRAVMGGCDKSGIQDGETSVRLRTHAPQRCCSCGSGEFTFQGDETRAILGLANLDPFQPDSGKNEGITTPLGVCVSP